MTENILRNAIDLALLWSFTGGRLWPKRVVTRLKWSTKKGDIEFVIILANFSVVLMGFFPKKEPLFDV